MDVFLQIFIDPVKWDAAGWGATAFFHDLTGVDPPGLGIVFDNIEIGKEIFSHWRTRLGSVDQYDELRISVVEGEILGLEPGYSIHISSNPSHTAERAKALGIALSVRTAVVIVRLNRMTPAPGSPHLARFKRDFAKHKRYFLLPVSADLKPEVELAIEKTEILFRNASEVRSDDLDAAGFPEHYFDRDRTLN
jgi:hypothetical protein